MLNMDSIESTQLTTSLGLRMHNYNRNCNYDMLSQMQFLAYPCNITVENYFVIECYTEELLMFHVNLTCTHLTS